MNSLAKTAAVGVVALVVGWCGGSLTGWPDWMPPGAESMPRLDEAAARRYGGDEVWVNTKRAPQGKIHRTGCRYYGIGHGYYTRRPPNEATECKLCGDGESLETRGQK